MDDFRLFFAYSGGMRDLSPTQVLAIIAQRMEARAKNLEAVRLDATTATALELRNFARMVRRALEYLRKQQIRR